jgi:uncharacterized protein (TIGR02145 family)
MTMTRLIQIIWFLLLGFSLQQCEKDSSQNKTEKNLNGQGEFLEDIDGNSYQAIGIGTQMWMTENLRTSRLNDGTIIKQVSDNNQWTFLHQPGLSWYNNDSIRNIVFGPLYNFYSVETKLLCPKGWHVPSMQDWDILAKYLGGTDVAGERLKAHYRTLYYYYWNVPTTSFSYPPSISALPGGLRKYSADFALKDSAAYFWTLNSDNNTIKFSIILKAGSAAVLSGYQSNNDGLSIRCIKDE